MDKYKACPGNMAATCIPSSSKIRGITCMFLLSWGQLEQEGSEVMLSVARMRLEHYPSLTPFPSQFSWSGTRQRLPHQPQGNYPDPCHRCKRVRLFQSSKQGQEVATGLVSAGHICRANLSLPKGLVPCGMSYWQPHPITRHETLTQQINISMSFSFLLISPAVDCKNP